MGSVVLHERAEHVAGNLLRALERESPRQPAARGVADDARAAGAQP